MFKFLVFVLILSFIMWNGIKIDIGSIFHYEVYPLNRFFNATWWWMIGVFIIGMGITMFVEWLSGNVKYIN